MSRSYGMMVKILGVNDSRRDELEEALQKEWPWEDWELYSGELWSYSESSLTGGETEDEFARRVARCVFLVRGPCEVEVYATYLDTPAERYHYCPEDYEELTQ